jgi:hypothetical protein
MSRKDRKRRQEEERQRLAESNAQVQERIVKSATEQANASRRWKWIAAGGGTLIIILTVVFVVNARVAAQQPGMYDSFAQCLTEKGVVVYGALATCKYTQAQANMFGNSFKYLDYRDYREYEGLPRITITPTWLIDDQRYERVQSFERLSALTGCPVR